MAELSHAVPLIARVNGRALGGCSRAIAGFEPHDLERVAALEPGFAMQDTGGRLEGLNAVLRRADLGGLQGAARARRYGPAVDQERQDGKAWVARFRC